MYLTGEGILLLLSSLRRGGVGGNATRRFDGGGGSDLDDEDPNEAEVARADVLCAEQGVAVSAMQEDVVDISLDDALEKGPGRSMLVTRASWSAAGAAAAVEVC